MHTKGVFVGRNFFQLCHDELSALHSRVSDTNLACGLREGRNNPSA